LVVPTALMEPDTRVATLLVPTRAMENQLHLAYVNRCDREGDLDYVGLSTLVAPDGTELLRAGAGEALLVGDTEPTVAHDFLERLSYLDDRRPELYGPLPTSPPPSPSRPAPTEEAMPSAGPTAAGTTTARESPLNRPGPAFPFAYDPSPKPPAAR